MFEKCWILRYVLGNASRACSDQGDDYRLPSLDEMISIALNYKLLDENMSMAYATATNADERAGGASKAWVHRAFGIGVMNFAVRDKTDTFAVRCIKR